MASAEVINLTPTIGDALSLDGGAYTIGLELDWGDHRVEPNLATGPDVIGGIVGTRQRATSECSIPVRIQAATPAAYLTAAEALSAVASDLALHGGTLTRQLRFTDGSLSEELETEVLSCDLDPEDGWLQPHRLTSVVTLNILRNPAWLAEEETVGTDTTFTDSVKRLTLTTRRGNLPGPGRIVLTDNDSTARRFVEVGGAFEQTPAQVEYLEADFTAVAGVTTVDADAIGGNALVVGTVLPAPQTVGTLDNLPLVGAYRVRLRFKGGEDDSEFFARVVWRSGTGPWKELDWVSAPDSTNYYDIDAGTILHMGNYASEDLTIRVDVKGSAYSTSDFALNAAYVTPSELYAVARGTAIALPSEAVEIYDDFSDELAGTAIAATVAPAGGTWSEAGDSSPDWSSYYGEAAWRTSADDTSTGSENGIANGQFLILGTSPTHDYTDITFSLRGGEVKHVGAKDTQSAVGLVLRYENTSNWILACVRNRRAGGGKYSKKLSLYKCVAGTVSLVKEKECSYWDGNLSAIIGNGSYLVTANAATLLTLEGTDADFNTGGTALNTGRVGIYSLVQSTNSTARTIVYAVSGYTDVNPLVYTDVIRDDGIGVLASDRAYTAATGGLDPQPITAYQGNRIWLPPGTGGEITAKVRTSDSDTQPDEGFDGDTGIEVLHRPAFATLSDTLEA